jgi:hypothetical protein
VNELSKYQTDLPASPTGYEELTIAAVVVRPTSAQVEKCRFAILVFTGGPARFRDDGVAPTAAIGSTLFNNQDLRLSIASLRQVRFIRSGATNMLARIRYYF